jgi:hypothetical protein
LLRFDWVSTDQEVNGRDKASRAEYTVRDDGYESGGDGATVVCQDATEPEPDRGLLKSVYFETYRPKARGSEYLSTRIIKQPGFQQV